jgi:hypothetical protein
MRRAQTLRRWVLRSKLRRLPTATSLLVLLVEMNMKILMPGARRSRPG